MLSALASAILLASGAMAADLSEAVKLMKQRDYAHAEPMLRQALEEENNAETRYLLGFLLIETYRFEEAEKQLRSAVSAYPQQHHWQMTLAKSLLEQGKNVAAGEVLELAISLDPQPAYYHAHAMASLNAGDLATAEASLRTCVELNTEHGDALYRLGVLLVDQGRYEEGIVFLDRARVVNPQNLDALYKLGLAYRYTGRPGEAEQFLFAVIVSVPGHVGALYNLSKIMIQSDNPAAAVSVMEQFRTMSKLRDEIDFTARAVRQNPDNINGRLFLADLYLRTGRTQEALTELLAARERAPRDARIYRSLGTAYRRLGDENRASRAERLANSIESAANG